MAANKLTPEREEWLLSWSEEAWQALQLLSARYAVPRCAGMYDHPDRELWEYITAVICVQYGGTKPGAREMLKKRREALDEKELRDRKREI